MLVNCWFLTWRAGSLVLCFALVKLFGLSYTKVRTLLCTHCAVYTTPLGLCLSVLFFGWSSHFLRILLGLKHYGMTCLKKIPLRHSWCLWNCNTLACVIFSICAVCADFSADLTEAQLGYPKVWSAFLNSLWSFCFPSALVGTYLHRCCGAHLCSSGWYESKSRNCWCVGFW